MPKRRRHGWPAAGATRPRRQRTGPPSEDYRPRRPSTFPGPKRKPLPEARPVRDQESPWSTPADLISAY